MSLVTQPLYNELMCVISSTIRSEKDEFEKYNLQRQLVYIYDLIGYFHLQSVEDGFVLKEHTYTLVLYGFLNEWSFVILDLLLKKTNHLGRVYTVSCHESGSLFLGKETIGLTLLDYCVYKFNRTSLICDKNERMKWMILSQQILQHGLIPRDFTILNVICPQIVTNPSTVVTLKRKYLETPNNATRILQRLKFMRDKADLARKSGNKCMEQEKERKGRIQHMAAVGIHINPIQRQLFTQTTTSLRIFCGTMDVVSLEEVDGFGDKLPDQDIQDARSLQTTLLNLLIQVYKSTLSGLDTSARFPLFDFVDNINHVDDFIDKQFVQDILNDSFNLYSLLSKFDNKEERNMILAYGKNSTHLCIRDEFEIFDNMFN